MDQGTQSHLRTSAAHAPTSTHVHTCKHSPLILELQKLIWNYQPKVGIEARRMQIPRHSGRKELTEATG